MGEETKWAPIKKDGKGVVGGGGRYYQEAIETVLFSFAETCQGNPGSKRYKFALTHYQDQSVRMNVPLALCL